MEQDLRPLFGVKFAKFLNSSVLILDEAIHGCYSKKFIVSTLY